MRHVFSFAVTLCAIAAPEWMASHAEEQPADETDGSVASVVNEDVPSRIRHMTSLLGYDSEVGDLFIEFVDAWRLPELKEQIETAKHGLEEGTQTTADVARTQSDVLDQLLRRVRATIEQVDGRSECFHLQLVLEKRQSQCLGNCQLFMVLGAAVGLDARPIDVIFPPFGYLNESMYHSATMVRLADGRVRMIDVRGDVNSPPFVFTKHYERHGAYWRLIQQSNAIRLHRQIRPIDLQAVRSDVLLSTGQTYKKTREDEARVLFEAALDLGPNSSRAVLQIAHCLELDGKFAESEALYQRAVKGDPDRAEAHFGYGCFLFRQGRLAEAKRFFDRAITLKPEVPTMLSERAAVLASLGEPRRARADVAKALQLQPDHLATLGLRAQFLVQDGDLQGALRDAETVLTRDPKNQRALTARTHVQMHRGEYEAAERDCDVLLAISPGDCKNWSSRGLCRSHLGRLREAMEDYCKAVELDPSDFQVLANMGYLHLEFGEPAKALADCDAALRVKPDYELALFNRGVALAQLGRKAEARESIERSVKAAPETQERAEAAIRRFGL